MKVTNINYKLNVLPYLPYFPCRRVVTFDRQGQSTSFPIHALQNRNWKKKKTQLVKLDQGFVCETFQSILRDRFRNLFERTSDLRYKKIQVQNSLCHFVLLG